MTQETQEEQNMIITFRAGLISPTDPDEPLIITLPIAGQRIREVIVSSGADNHAYTSCGFRVYVDGVLVFPATGSVDIDAAGNWCAIPYLGYPLTLPGSELIVPGAHVESLALHFYNASDFFVSLFGFVITD